MTVKKYLKLDGRLTTARTSIDRKANEVCFGIKLQTSLETTNELMK